VSDMSTFETGAVDGRFQLSNQLAYRRSSPCRRNRRFYLPLEPRPSTIRYLSALGLVLIYTSGKKLTLSMTHYSVFNGYREGPVTFRPTYKYDKCVDCLSISYVTAWAESFGGIQRFDGIRYEREAASAVMDR
jgi:hypothetical protein